MPIPRSWFTARGLMVLVAGMALLFGLLANLDRQQRLKGDYLRERTRFQGLLFELDRKVPQGDYRPARDEAFQMIYEAGYSTEPPFLDGVSRTWPACATISRGS